MCQIIIIFLKVVSKNTYKPILSRYFTLYIRR
jgi:hypothetical protein